MIWCPQLPYNFVPVRYYIVVGRGRRFVLFNSSEMIRCSNFQFTRNVIFFIAITIYNEWKELINYDPYLCTLVEGVYSFQWLQFISIDLQLFFVSWFIEFYKYYILLSLHSFDRDWKKIEAFIGSKTVIQVTSSTSTYSGWWYVSSALMRWLSAHEPIGQCSPIVFPY